MHYHYSIVLSWLFHYLDFLIAYDSACISYLWICPDLYRCRLIAHVSFFPLPVSHSGVSPYYFIRVFLLLVWCSYSFTIPYLCISDALWFKLSLLLSLYMLLPISCQYRTTSYWQLVFYLNVAVWPFHISFPLFSWIYRLYLQSLPFLFFCMVLRSSSRTYPFSFYSYLFALDCHAALLCCSYLLPFSFSFADLFCAFSPLLPIRCSRLSYYFIVYICC